MRILVLSNYFPPTRSWGYTQLCHEVVQGLRARGHELRVLTSIGPPGPDEDRQINVYRRLHPESDPNYYRPLSFFTTRRIYLHQDLATLRAIVADYQPQLIFIWGMWNTPKQIPAEAEALGCSAVAYYLSDKWPALPSAYEHYWNLLPRRRYMRPIKSILRLMVRMILRLEGNRRALQFENAMCVSSALRDALIGSDVPVQSARIVHNGIDLSAFVQNSVPTGSKPADQRFKMIVAGRLTHEKGIHTALEASSILLEAGIANHHLTVIGDGHPDYVSKLQSLRASRNLQSHVSFQQRVDREDMPEVLRQHHVLIFPSIGFEALPRLPMEAMACGLVVIGTTTGGTVELLVEGQTGLTFPPDDAYALASQLTKLIEEPSYRKELAQKGRECVIARFKLERMIHEIERYLEECVQTFERSHSPLPA